MHESIIYEEMYKGLFTERKVKFPKKELLLQES